MPPVLPSVTLLVPTFNEAASIDHCLASLEAQDYAGELDIVVADGRSTDGTRAALERWTQRLRLTVIDNPERRQAAGLNLAAQAATGEVLVRIDAHTRYAADYVSASIRALNASGARAAGGPLRPVGLTTFGRAVAAAMRSPLATGPARFHRGVAGEADTVYLGAFSREDFNALGGFRAFPSGSGEDADFYFRMRRRGWKVYVDPSIRSEYLPRHHPKRLLEQHVRYGWVKSEMLWANGVLPSWRPLAPAVLVVGLAATLALGPVIGWWPLAVAGGAWSAALLVAGASTPRLLPLVMFAAAIMQIGYGIGFWIGVLRGPRSVRRALAGQGLSDR